MSRGKPIHTLAQTNWSAPPVCVRVAIWRSARLTFMRSATAPESIVEAVAAKESWNVQLRAEAAVSGTSANVHVHGLFAHPARSLTPVPKNSDVP